MVSKDHGLRQKWKLKHAEQVERPKLKEKFIGFQELYLNWKKVSQLGKFDRELGIVNRFKANLYLDTNLLLESEDVNLVRQLNINPSFVENNLFGSDVKFAIEAIKKGE